MQQPKILFEDNHILLLEKPGGLITQPLEEMGESLQTWAQQWIKTKKNKPGNVFLHAVHRLDKSVSGMVLFAKTSKALQRLNAAFREKKVIKKYVALVEGSLPSTNGRLEHYLVKKDFKTEVSEKTENGKKGVLEYSILKRYSQHCYVEVSLHTGLYHQIRVQLSATGCPIVGDEKYGSVVKKDSIALHHAFFSFPHPISKEIISFHSTPPFELWSSLFSHVPKELWR